MLTVFFEPPGTRDVAGKMGDSHGARYILSWKERKLKIVTLREEMLQFLQLVKGIPLTPSATKVTVARKHYVVALTVESLLFVTNQEKKYFHDHVTMTMIDVMVGIV